MEPIYIRELNPYSKSEILDNIGGNERIFNRLRDYAIINKDNDRYQFKFVGVLIVEDSVINCYPKYINNTDNIKEDFKQVLNVIKKYKKLHDDFFV